MNRIRLMSILFLSTIALFGYQNCQQIGFTGDEGETQQSSLSTETSTVKFELNYHMGYGYCMGRCMTGTKISANLDDGQIIFNNYFMDNSPEISSTALPLPGPISIALNRSQYVRMKQLVQDLDIEIRDIPACNPEEGCGMVMDNPYYTHFFTDSLGETHKAFTENGIDPNLYGATVWILKDPKPLACELKKIVEDSSISESDKADSVEAIKTALHFYDTYNPLECE